MKKMKTIFTKISTCFLAAIMCFFACSAGVFAADIKQEKEPQDYITFTPSQSRMESDGSFEFELHARLESGKFKANGTEITIQTACVIKLYDGTGREYTDSSEKFMVTLYRSGFIPTAVGSYVGNADNIYGGLTFTNIKQGKKYYFVIAPVDPNFSLSPKYLKGYGRVYDVTVL